jgi:hypothetical protein
MVNIADVGIGADAVPDQIPDLSAPHIAIAYKEYIVVTLLQLASA